MSRDPLSDFIAAMASAGIRTPDKIIGDGKLHRIYMEGDRKGTKNAFYTLHLDPPESGAFGSWKHGINDTWTVEKPERLNDDQRRALRERMDRLKQERAAETARAHAMARTAAAAIMAASVKADPAHPYLVAKGIGGIPGAYQLREDVRYEVADDEKPKRVARKGVLVNPIKSSDGTLHSVQTIDAEGRKHFIKGTNKSGHYRSIGKLTARIIIAEGFSTAATIHLATGDCVVVAFDSGNLEPVARAIRAKFPDHEIVIGADNDRLTLKPVPNPGMTKACEAAVAVGARVAWPEFERDAELPGGGTPTDFNDLATLRGNLESVLACFEAATFPEDIENHTDPRRPQPAPPSAAVEAGSVSQHHGAPHLSDRAAFQLRSRGFEWGSEVEIAKGFYDTACRELGSLIYSEGLFWSFTGRCWAALDAHQMRRVLHLLDGAEVGGGGRSGKQLKLGSRMIDGVVRELAVMAGDERFFAEPAPGIPARNCLIRFEPDGRVRTVPHHPDHRRRFVIDADFDTLATPAEPPAGSLLHRLFAGAFHGDADAADKTLLIAEALGAAAAGIATRLGQPKALILHGPSASNGKSSIGALFKALLPPSAVCSVAPAAMSDERQVVHLAGKAANVADELGGAAVAGEALKKAVTGDPMSGRDVYKSACTFKPEAMHVFTTNRLPHFSGGLDRGLQRRLVVVDFNRPIPKAEIVPNIGERIATEELDGLLGFAVLGTSRLVRNGAFSIPASSRAALEGWLRDEPLIQWSEMRLKPVAEPPARGWHKTADLFADFVRWAKDEGYRDGALPQPNTFAKQLRGIEGVRDLVRRADGTRAVGVVLSGQF